MEKWFKDQEIANQLMEKVKRNERENNRKTKKKKNKSIKMNFEVLDLNFWLLLTLNLK